MVNHFCYYHMTILHILTYDIINKVYNILYKLILLQYLLYNLINILGNYINQIISFKHLYNFVWLKLYIIENIISLF